MVCSGDLCTLHFPFRIFLNHISCATRKCGTLTRCKVGHLVPVYRKATVNMADMKHCNNSEDRANY